MRFADATFRPAFGRVLSVIVCVICAAGLIGFVVAGDVASLSRFSWPVLLVATLALALFYFPAVAVAEDGVTVRNVFSTVHIAWASIQRIDTKYALALTTSGGTISVWASPAPSRYAGQVSAHRDVTLAATDQGGSIRPGDLLSSASGAPAFVIRQHWNELRDDGLLELGSEGTALPRRIHWVTIGVIGVLCIATVLGILL